MTIAARWVAVKGAVKSAQDRELAAMSAARRAAELKEATWLDGLAREFGGAGLDELATINKLNGELAELDEYRDDLVRERTAAAARLAELDAKATDLAGASLSDLVKIASKTAGARDAERAAAVAVLAELDRRAAAVATRQGEAKRAAGELQAAWLNRAASARAAAGLLLLEQITAVLKDAARIENAAMDAGGATYTRFPRGWLDRCAGVLENCRKEQATWPGAAAAR